MSFRRTVKRLVALVSKRHLDRELDAEIAAHLELAERDAAARGMSPEDARRAARLEFGGVEQIKEEHRDRRSFPLIETLFRDFRYGMWSLRRNPGFAVAAVGVLALGIGANTAMFSVVDAVLLKPLPYPEPERIVTVIEADNTRRWGVSALNFVDWKRLSTSFESLAAQHYSSAAVLVNGEPARWMGVLVTADYFKVFRTRAMLGRTFAPGEDQPGAARVVVLSHSTWQTWFGGAPDIVNRDLIIDGEPHRVIGVLPRGSFDRQGAMFWKPLIFTPGELTRETMWLGAIGRLRGGVTLDQARQELLRISASLESLNPAWKRGWRAAVDPFGENIVNGRLRQSIYVAFGAVVMVLLIACSNIANLLLAKGVTRTREFAVRAALGASRGRLIGQLLAESLALCVFGGAVGVALAELLIEAARPAWSRVLPPTAEVSMDVSVLAFAGGMIVAIALLVGLLPALRTSAATMGASLNQGTRSSQGSRALLRRAMVAGEVAISLVLICGALLMFRSLFNLQNADAGVRIENVITANFELPAAAYPSAESAIRFSQSLSERVRAIPGVERAAVATGLPFQGLGEGGVIVTPDLPGNVLTVGIKHIDPNYFEALGISVLAGRRFNDRDRRGAPLVMIVNEEAAARLPSTRGRAGLIGKEVGLSISPYGSMQADLPQMQIVGVIRSERVGRLNDPVEPVVYLPMAQEPTPYMSLLVRTERETLAVMPGIREAVRQIDPGLPLGPVSTMQEVKEASFSDATQSAWILGIFALVAALLAAFGLYGVLAQAVTQQRREFGIRMALGAGPREIVAGVLRTAVPMIAIGVAVGLGGAFALTGVLRSLLFNVSALDPAAFALACASMTAVGLLAVLVPATRAAAVDPVTTLREEG